MSIILRKVHTKYDLNRTQDKIVIYLHCGCHGNQVTMATKYVTNVCCPKEIFIPNMISIGLKTKELFT